MDNEITAEQYFALEPVSWADLCAEFGLAPESSPEAVALRLIARIDDPTVTNVLEWCCDVRDTTWVDPEIREESPESFTARMLGELHWMSR